MAGTKLFADRGFVTINGFEAVHLKSAELDIDEALARVSTMTRNRRDAGYKYGNRKVSISAEFDIEADKAQIDLALADKGADIRIVFEVGGERYTTTGVAQGRQTLRASVGDGSKSANFEALDCTNENGTSVNTGISLG